VKFRCPSQQAGSTPRLFSCIEKSKPVKILEGSFIVMHDPSVVNEDNLRNVRREASRHFRSKKRKCLKDKINEIELNSKNKNIRDLYRGITEFKKGYQPKTNLLKDERGNLLADPQKFCLGGRITSVSY
jgi:hypothetical protein